MEPKASMPFSQELAIFPYSEPMTSVYISQNFFFKIRYKYMDTVQIIDILHETRMIGQHF
jgi:hypothetical protein